MSSPTQSNKPAKGIRPSRSVIYSLDKYINVVKAFISDIPDGVKFTPEDPTMFERSSTSSPELT
jgi:hypothetical protein